MSDEPAVPPVRLLSFAPKESSELKWSPKECVAEFAADVAAEKIVPTKVMILWFSEDPETNRMRPNRWFANVSHAEAIALLELGKHIEIADWRGE